MDESRPEAHFLCSTLQSDLDKVNPPPKANYVIEHTTSLALQYDLGKTIGQGEFAKVKLARCRKTNELV